MKKQNSLIGKKRLKHSSSKDKLIRKKSSKQIKIRGPWSEKEDQLLIKWVENHGAKNWARCAETIKGRNGKQCREHWNNSLNYSIKKGKWSLEEDLFIMVFYDKLDKSWKKMIPLFKSRTENAIKNRFFSQLRKITAKYIKRDKSEYNTKFKLDTLMKYYNEGVTEAKNDFFKEYPMKEEEFNSFINDVEDLVKNKKKNQAFIDLDDVRKKYFSNFNINNNDNNKEINDDNINDLENKEEIKNDEDKKEENVLEDKNEEDNKNENNNEDKKEEINKKEKNDKDSISSNNNNDDEKDVNSISITGYNEDNNEKQENEDKKYKFNMENTETKKDNENSKIDNTKNTKKNFNFNFPNNISNRNNIAELKNNLNKDKINIFGQNNINNLNINLGNNNYINIYNNNNNNYLNNNSQTNTKDTNNLNNINYIFNNAPNFDLNLNKSNQNSSTFLKKPSGIQDYRKNFTGLRNINFKNTFMNNEFGIESPFNRLNSNIIDSSLNPFPSYNNNYFNYNIFKPINNPNELFNLDKQNLYNSINSSNIFKHSDSTDINKLTKLNTPFIPFGYKRSTSFGSIIDGKIYDNNNTNCDNNK